ncbi:hypothetical protein [Dyadobacter sp. CY326]|uniref:hypothetical protein n=1 Tax=Dyadobacter sp. CY326 TaxID=2907300 RepID=UPI001F27AA1C|nr:hypothetical protein [Dyadobacter sp. CY326]MCE7064021.1 hypothetical protein [Dyadobacter sp. CY326]
MRGKTNNPNGRPKGVPNKKNAELRERVTALIENNWPKVQSDLDLLEPKDRLAFLEKLFSYTLPKLQSVQMEIDNQREQQESVVVFAIPDNGRNVDFKSLSDQELRNIVAAGEKHLKIGEGESH